MSKTASVQLKVDYGLGSTTIARCWRATRKDGFSLAVTTCARDLLFEGVLYRASEGFNPRAIEQEASTAVANTEVEGALSDDITELEFEAGLWDGASVEVFELNYRSIANGKMSFGVATMGDIRVTRSAFNAELRGLAQSLQKIVGRTYLATCPWGFGDSRCRINLAPITVAGTITGAPDRRTIVDTSRSEPSDYFGAGRLLMTSGAAEGEEIEVYSYDGATKTFVLHLPFHRNIAAGDTYEAIPGCRKRWNEDCKGKWANGNRFGGYPYLPGPDRVIGLGGTEGANQ